MGFKNTMYVYAVGKIYSFLGGAPSLFQGEVCTYTYFTKQRICGEWESFEKSLYMLAFDYMYVYIIDSYYCMTHCIV